MSANLGASEVDEPMILAPSVEHPLEAFVR
jgi:hypothetical protein